MLTFDQKGEATVQITTTKIASRHQWTKQKDPSGGHAVTRVKKDSRGRTCINNVDSECSGEDPYTSKRHCRGGIKRHCRGGMALKRHCRGGMVLNTTHIMI
mmetsp:Transcript_2820/g.6018  ORF Transcript_2820/g.6018 Transcript_2820/m.6018 type:complete len:101 (+) Transcript_2820:274-576(+)